ncbi:MAG: T9SS type A sorting domain-containing protein, partial [Bacteroidota bacterium]
RELSYLYISGNKSLKDISTLIHIKSMEYGVSISYSPLLKDLRGLDSLTMAGMLVLHNNPSLVDISQLSQLDSIERVVNIGDNDSLTNLRGLEGIRSVDALFISNHKQLTDISQLYNLQLIRRQLSIVNNEVLNSLEGLGSIDAQAPENLTIQDCPELSLCHVPIVCSFLETSTRANIYRNKEGCQSAQEILDQCMTTSTTEVNQEGLQIFPNPTTGILNLNGVALQNWAIFDTAGKRWEVPQQGQQLDCSALPQGLYILQVDTGKEIISQKILKQ